MLLSGSVGRLGSYALQIAIFASPFRRAALQIAMRRQFARGLPSATGYNEHPIRRRGGRTIA